MSRARLFKRAADWLKNCVQTKEKIAEAKDRQRAFRFAFGQLEERVVLDADFTFDGIELEMDNYTSMGSEALNVSDTGTHFEFALAEGVWNGLDSVLAVGNGTDTLSLDKSALPLSITSNGAGIDVNFDTVDFDSALLDDVSFIGGNVTQSGGITADFVSFTIDATSVDLQNAANDFSLIDVTSALGISIADVDDVAVTARTTSDIGVEAGGNVGFSGDNFAGLGNVDLVSTVGGANGDVTVFDVDAASISITAGTGNVDAFAANNHSELWSVISANDVAIFDSESTQLQEITAASLSVTAADVDLGSGDVNVASASLNVDSLSQNDIGNLITPELTINTADSVSLTNAGNAIDNLAGVIGGNLDLVNSVNLNIAELTFGAITTPGLTVTGDVDIEMVDLDLVSVEPLVVGGTLGLTMGIGCVNFENSSNDFNAVNIVSAGEAIIYDANDLSILFAEISDQVIFETFGEINVDGNISVTNTVAFNSSLDVNQNSGVISASSLMVSADNATLDGLNEIGSAGVDGLVSAQLTGDFVFQNVFGIDITDQVHLTKSGAPTIIDGLRVIGEACLHVDSLTVSSATFDVGSLLVDSNNGFAPGVDVIADDLILIGSGLFDLSGANEIARIATDIDGDLILNNEIDIEIADLIVCGNPVVGMGVTGDLTLTTSDDSVTQSAVAIVGGASQFTLGTGSATLDDVGNDFNMVEVTSSDDFVIVDSNDLSLTGATATTLSVTAANVDQQDGAITANQVFISADSFTQAGLGSLISPELTLNTTGDAILTVAGNMVDNLAGVIGGNLDLVNSVNLNIAELTFDGIPTTGLTVTGDVDIEMVDLDLVSVEPIAVGGALNLTMGIGCVDFSNIANDFNTVNIISAGEAEISDANDLSVLGATISNQAVFIAGNDLNLDGSVTATNLLGLGALNNVTQNSGILSSSGLMLNVGVDALLDGLNEIGSAGVDGLLSAQIGGNLDFQNVFGIDIADQTYVTKSSPDIDIFGLTVGGEACLHVDSLTVSSATFNVGSLIFDSSNGFTAASPIVANEVILTGAGIFDLSAANEIARIATDIDGSLILNNEIDLEIADLTVCTVQVVGMNVTGDLTLLTSDDSVTQTAIAIVGGASQFTLGTGSATLDNIDNDFNMVEVVTSDSFVLFDSNALDVTAANGADLSFESIDGMTLNGDLDGSGTVSLTAGAGVEQASGIIGTPDLTLVGSGAFNLMGLNDIGDGGAGLVSVNIIDGDLLLTNENDLEFTRSAGVAAGANFAGDVSITLSDDDLTQAADTPVRFSGTSTFTVGLGDICLEFGDDTADAINDNALNVVNIISAAVAEIVEFDGFTLNDAALTDRLILETVAGDLGLTGTIVSPNGLLLISSGSIIQSSGSIDAPTLLATAAADVDLGQANTLGSALPGVIAGVSGGDFIVTNSLASLIGTVTINRKDGTPVTLTGIEALNVKLTALQILVNAATTATENIVLDSQNGVGQNADGILTAAGIALAGEGDFDLTQANEIGTLVDPGKFAADVLGSISLTNLYSLLIAKISCGTMVYTGVNLGAGAGSGNLTINTTANNGNIDQEADAPIVVSGTTRFNVGTGTICLTKGDSDSDLMTNNDLNSLFIDAATIVEIADVNGLITEDIVDLEKVSLEAGGAIQLNNDLIADSIRLKAGDGVTQAASTFLITLELLLEGEGDFVLTERNRIGGTFNEGKIAANIAGSLNVFNDFDLVIDEVTYEFKDTTTTSFAGINVDIGGSTGNLTIVNSNDDIRQSILGSVVVLGMTSIDAGTGCIHLNMAGSNNIVEFEVINSSEVELNDVVGDLLIGDLNATTQALLISNGLMTLGGDIDAGDRLMVVSNGGVRQGFISTLVAAELMVTGTGDFTFDRGNTIQSPATLIGNIAVDVDGNFVLVNANETVASSLSYDTKNNVEIGVIGVDVTGNFMVTLPDSDFHQDTDAAIIVGGIATFDVGLGCVDLSFGDESGDLMNENNFNEVVVTAAVVDLVDVDGFTLGANEVSDRMRIESQSGTIVIDRDIRAANQLMIVSADGLTQNIGTVIETAEFLVTGTGDFIFGQANLIGNSATPGQVAAMIDGSLLLQNSFGINVASLSYVNKDASTTDIDGVTLDNTTGSGDLTIDADGQTVSQSSSVAVLSLGLTTFDVGLTGTVNLPETVNDFTTIAIDSSLVSEITDMNDVTIVGALANSRLAITSDTGEIFLDGNIDVTSVAKFDAANGLSQLNGTIESDSLLLVGSGYFDLANPNRVGEDFGSSSFAADVNGDVNFVNSNRVVVNSVSYTDLAGSTTTATGVGGNLDNFRLNANGIVLRQRSEADTIVFETSAGINQINDPLTDGIIVANDFALNGFGLATLTEDNLIGRSFSSANVSIDFEGDVRLNTLFGVDFDDVAFDNKDGSRTTHSDVDVDSLGNASGNFELFTGGSITDAATTAISVEGRTSFSANDGASDIVLGDRFSSTGGFNNVTHFGTIGLKGNNVNISEDSGMMLDGMIVSGDLELSAFGSIAQTGEDPFSLAGGEGLEVEGDANFLVDALEEATNHLNDNLGRDVLLMSDADDNLIDNFFAGLVTIEGTASSGELNGSGTLRNVRLRNMEFENPAFPVINAPNDPLRTLSVWAPNSSLVISDDLDIALNLTVRAGVDSNNGILGGNLMVTNSLLTRRITDEAGVSITVGQNAVFESSNSVILAEQADNVLSVGGRLQTSTHGGDAGSRIRVGISNNGNRGDDSGATVNAAELRFRAKPTTLANSEHASFNIDNAVEIVGANVARSLMLVVDGGITDDSNARINVKNSTTLIAENDSDIILGESFSTNFVNNNVHNFGALAIKAGNAEITEDSALLLDGIKVTGDLSITAKGHIRQSGRDRFSQVGTEFIEVDGDATFRVDKQQLAVDHLNDIIGQDVMLMANVQKQLMDNRFMGNVVITSTDFDNSQNKNGSVRNVEIRNISESATMPVFNLTSVDTVRNLHIWVPNSSLQLRNSMTIEKDFRVFAGIDSSNGLRNGRLQISDNLLERNLNDAANVNFRVKGNMEFRSANFMRLADNASDTYVVDGRSTFITLGGGQGNQISVGVDPSAVRGTDSGANVQTDILKFRAPISGNFGLVTIAVDGTFTVTADSQARSSVVS